MDAVAIREKLRAFVTEQSAGEWDDKTISEDTTKLQAIVEEIVADAVSFAGLSIPLPLKNFDGVQENALVNPNYILSEPHLSGHRVILGYEKLQDAGSTLGFLARCFNLLREGGLKKNGLDFSEALLAMKAGKAVARAGWNGKGMFIYMVPAAEYRAQTLVAKALFGEMVPYGAYTAMKTADGNVVPWLCSQSDQYATDWEIVSV